MNENKKLEQEFLLLIEKAGEKAKEQKPSKERLQRRIDNNLKLNKELNENQRKSIFWGMQYGMLRRYIKPSLAIAALLVTFFIGYFFFNLNQSKYSTPEPQLSDVPVLDSISKFSQHDADSISREIKENTKSEISKSDKQAKIQSTILLAVPMKKSSDSFGFADNVTPMAIDQILDNLENKINTELGQELVFEQNENSRISEWFYITGLQDNEYPKGRLAMDARNDSLFLLLEKSSDDLSKKVNMKRINNVKFILLKRIE